MTLHLQLSPVRRLNLPGSDLNINRSPMASSLVLVPDCGTQFRVVAQRELNDAALTVVSSAKVEFAGFRSEHQSIANGIEPCASARLRYAVPCCCTKRTE